MTSKMPFVVAMISEHGKLSYLGESSFSCRPKINRNMYAPSFFWHGNEDRINAEVDPLGLASVYYTKTSDGLAISTNIEALLDFSKSRDIDYSALAVFLRFGSYIEEETPFKEIKVLPPGGKLSFSADGVKVSFKKSATPKMAKLSLEDAACEFAEIFHESVSKDLSGERPIIPLTGGRDSRHIFFAAVGSGCSVARCVTASQFPPKSRDEIEVAKSIARQAGVLHETVEQTLSGVAAEVQKNYLTNFSSLDHSWGIALRNYFLVNEISHQHPLLIDGLGGDVLTGQTVFKRKILENNFYYSYRNAFFKKLANDMLSDESDLENILSQEFFRLCPRWVAIENMSRRLADFENFPNPVSAFFFRTRTRRATSALPICMLSDIFDIRFPYVSRECLEFLETLNGEALVEFNLHDVAIEKKYPQLNKFRYENKNKTAGFRGGLWLRRFAWETAEYLRENKGMMTLVDAERAEKLLRRWAFARTRRKGVVGYIRKVIYLCELESLSKGHKENRWRTGD